MFRRNGVAVQDLIGKDGVRPDTKVATKRKRGDISADQGMHWFRLIGRYIIRPRRTLTYG